jgi:UDP-glucose 4-epimerase
MYWAVLDSSLSVSSSICNLDKLKNAFSELDIIAELIINNTITPKQINTVTHSAGAKAVLNTANIKLTGGSDAKLLSKVLFLSYKLVLKR